MRLILALLALVPNPAGAAPVPDLAATEAVLRQAEPAIAGPRSPGRIEAMASVHRVTLELGGPAAKDADAQRRWFARLREKAQSAADPEVAYFFQTELRFDPAGASFEMLDARPVSKAPYQPGQGVAAQLADTARSLDLGEAPRMTSSQLLALATDPKLDAAMSDRALVLLRRLDPANASRPLWDRLMGSRKRSDILGWEEQILRLPPAQVGKVAYDENASPAARAAWFRIAAVRPAVPVAVPDRAGWIALLKGPANEITEAAWDAAPRVFGRSDRAELEALTQGASERLAPRMKAALDRLR